MPNLTDLPSDSPVLPATEQNSLNDADLAKKQFPFFKVILITINFIIFVTAAYLLYLNFNQKSTPAPSVQPVDLANDGNYLKLGINSKIPAVKSVFAVYNFEGTITNIRRNEDTQLVIETDINDIGKYNVFPLYDETSIKRLENGRLVATNSGALKVNQKVYINAFFRNLDQKWITSYIRIE